MEGEQEPPLIRGCPANRAGFQFGGHLVGQLEGGLAAAGPGEEINGSPQAAFQADSGTARHGRGDRLLDQRVITVPRPGPGEPEHGRQQLLALAGALGRRAGSSARAAVATS